MDLFVRAMLFSLALRVADSLPAGHRSCRICLLTHWPTSNRCMALGLCRGHRTIWRGSPRNREVDRRRVSRRFLLGCVSQADSRHALAINRLLPACPRTHQPTSLQARLTAPPTAPMLLETRLAASPRSSAPWWAPGWLLSVRGRLTLPSVVDAPRPRYHTHISPNWL